ncbi:putative uncharacterized protein CIMIP3 isoform X2 [Littorina saxatilis]
MQLEEYPPSHVHIDFNPVGGARGTEDIFNLGQLEQQRLTWEYLETIRLKKLRIPNRYSRHLGKGFTMPREEHPLQGPAWNNSLKPTPVNGVGSIKDEKQGAKCINNSIAPFFTVGKPTCGYFFSRSTDNKKRNIGIPPSDVVKWRSFAQ